MARLIGQVCRECGYTFSVMLTDGKTEVKDDEDGKKVSMAVRMEAARYCPRCGKEL